MEKYNAWIKELSTIVYDNSKSEYQILSELIPILLNIKSSQDTNSELMDTIHETVFNKVNELESGMDTFTETFIGKLNEFKQEFSPQLDEFTSTLKTNIAEFKEKINNKISTFNTTYASEKASIKEIVDSINNINDTLISGYNEILSKINNYVEPIINSASENIINNAIEEKFAPTYLARESIYIDLVSVTTAPSSANEGDIYYNASEYQLYKYTSGAWVEEAYTTNKLYRYQNNLYHIDIIKTDKTRINSLNQSEMAKGRGDTFIGFPSNAGNNIKVNINNINGGSEQLSFETYPEYWGPYEYFTDVFYDETNDIYYMRYGNDDIATAQDLINWTFLTHKPIDKTDNIFIANGTLYWGSYKYVNNEWVRLPYYLLGYADNKFWRYNSSDKSIYTATSDDFSDEELYYTSPTNLSNDVFYYYNGLLKIGPTVIYNKEIIGRFTYYFVAYGNTKCNFIRNYILTNNGNVLIYSSNSLPSTQSLKYDDYTIFSFDNFQTNRYILRVGLVPYE